MEVFVFKYNLDNAYDDYKIYDSIDKANEVFNKMLAHKLGGDGEFKVDIPTTTTTWKDENYIGWYFTEDMPYLYIEDRKNPKHFLSLRIERKSVL